MAKDVLKVAQEYVLARRVLLDALAALGDQREAVILVGAQAIYATVGAADLAVVPSTTDGDLAVDPRALLEIPLISEAMAAGGFVPMDQPGSWRGAGGVAIDLMVPETLATNTRRRSVDLGVHGRRAARLTPGLEAAVVDFSRQRFGALEQGDLRCHDLRVAGPAALLVAKLHKLGERLGTKRMADKDALDVLRLLRGTETGPLAGRLRELEADPVAGAATRAAREHLGAVFTRPGSPGPAMAARASAFAESEAVVRASTEILARELGRSWEGGRT